MKKLFTLLALFVSVFTLVLVAKTKNVEAANTDNSNEKWYAIGTINGTSWNTDFELKYDATDDRYELEIALTAGNEFKIRKDKAWTTSIGYGGNTGAGISTYLSNSGGNFKVKTTGNYILWVKDDNVRNYGDKSYGFGIDKAAEVVYYTVKHFDKDGAELKSEQVIAKSAYQPAFAEVEGYRLEGWYKDANLTTKMEKGAEVTGNLTLYPKYVPAEDYVIYVKDDSKLLGGAVYAYMYSDKFDGHYDAAWPGTALTKDGDRGYKVVIKGSKSFDTIIFNVGNDLTVASNGDTFIIAQSGSNITATVEKTGAKYAFEDLLNGYYNDGVYTKETVINLTEEATQELKEEGYWHAGVSLLERTTYYNVNELWMTNHKDGYSYYGTKGNDMTHAYVSSLEETSDTVVVTGKTMTQYYVGLEDIVETFDVWTLTNGVYTTADAEVLEMFKAFAAPCYAGANSNYVTLTSASIRVVDGNLVLQLHASSNTGALTAGDVFAQATILAQ